MAVVTASTAGIKRYLGLSADVKPTVSTPVGSTFTEMDSGIEFMYDGNTWTPVSSDGVGAESKLAEAVELLAGISEKMTLLIELIGEE